MRNIRFLRFAIFFLVCTNLLLLFLNYGKPKHPPRLSHIVEAQGKQAVQLDKEMHRHHRSVVKWTQQQFELRQKLANSNPNDALQRTTLLEQIAACQRNIDSITIAHFDRVEKICSPSQEKRFRKFRNRILQPKPIRP